MNPITTREQFDAYAGNKQDSTYRSEAARCIDFIPTPDQIETGINDDTRNPRIDWIKRRDFVPTASQIASGLEHPDFVTRREWLLRDDFTLTEAELDAQLFSSWMPYSTRIALADRPEFVMTPERISRIFDVSDKTYSADMIIAFSRRYCKDPSISLNNAQIALIQAVKPKSVFLKSWKTRDDEIRSFIAIQAANELNASSEPRFPRRPGL